MRWLFSEEETLHLLFGVLLIGWGAVSATPKFMASVRPPRQLTAAEANSLSISETGGRVVITDLRPLCDPELSPTTRRRMWPAMGADEQSFVIIEAATPIECSATPTSLP
jgi:hypothetical protein